MGGPALPGPSRKRGRSANAGAEYAQRFRRLAVQFVLVGGGDVAIARSNASTLENPALECCIPSAARSWHFGRADVDEGIVLVDYPFILEQKTHVT